jgi:hypothetical protein
MGTAGRIPCNAGVRLQSHAVAQCRTLAGADEFTPTNLTEFDRREPKSLTAHVSLKPRNRGATDVNRSKVIVPVAFKAVPHDHGLPSAALARHE